LELIGPKGNDVAITLTANEAIVLSAFLQRFSNTGKPTIEDQAEERASCLPAYIRKPCRQCEIGCEMKNNSMFR